MKKNVGFLVFLGLIATLAFAAASSDRLKDTVIIGQGTSSTKTVTFDLGNGSSNPVVSATSANAIVVGAGEGGTPLTTMVRGPAAAGSNKAGANVTFAASNGTGTGGSGKIIFQTAPIAGSSSTANTLANRLTFDNSGKSIFGDNDGTTTPNAGDIYAASGAGSNIAGASLNFSAGNGTGSGGSGKIIFNIAPAAGSSSTANTYENILTLKKDGTTVLGKGDGTTGPGSGVLSAASGAGSNISGTTLEINAGNGTGTGGSGAINFRTAPAAGSSSTANTYATALSISNTGTMEMGGNGAFKIKVFTGTLAASGDLVLTVGTTILSASGRTEFNGSSADNRIMTPISAAGGTNCTAGVSSCILFNDNNTNAANEVTISNQDTNSSNGYEVVVFYQ